MAVDLKEVAYNIRKFNLSPFIFKALGPIFSPFNHDGIDVVDEDWDNLIILDACRFDYFKQNNNLSGDLNKKISKGAATKEWLEENFKEEYPEIVYVSANPFIAPQAFPKVSPEQFHDVYLPVFDDEGQELNATKPECVNEYARKAMEEHPDKRLIIHYIQPHAPYIGREREGSKTLYNLYKGGYSQERIRELYESNLERVLENVRDLIPELDGKTVVTSDHGEMLGEKKLFGHQRGIYLKELVEVPWLEIEDK